MRAILRGMVGFGLAVWVAQPALVRGTTIAEVAADGAGFNGQQVTVAGTVTTPRYQAAGESVYTLSDADRRITVFSKQGAPAEGAHIEVVATVGWREGDEEFTFPPILFESARHTP